MLPFRSPIPARRPTASAAGRRRMSALASAALALALAVLALAVLAVVAVGSAGTVLAVLAIVLLGAAAVLGLRSHWASAAPDAVPAATGVRAPVAPPETVAPDQLTERLRRLHDEHVELVNMAVAEGREDLVQELSDSYVNQALGLIISEGRSPQVG
jgi:hypothetical protein